jgi:GxxExxY protein
MEIQKIKLQVEQQHGIKVKYDGLIVGEFAADLLIEKKVLVELKAVKALEDAHISQCLNYLKATGLSVCLLVNFGKPKAEIRRIVNNF